MKLTAPIILAIGGRRRAMSLAEQVFNETTARYWVASDLAAGTPTADGEWVDRNLGTVADMATPPDVAAGVATFDGTAGAQARTLAADTPQLDLPNGDAFTLLVRAAMPTSGTTSRLWTIEATGFNPMVMFVAGDTRQVGVYLNDGSDPFFFGAFGGQGTPPVMNADTWRNVAFRIDATTAILSGDDGTSVSASTTGVGDLTSTYGATLFGDEGASTFSYPGSVSHWLHVQRKLTNDEVVAIWAAWDAEMGA